MPLTLAQLQTKKATVPVFDGQVNVTYNVDKITAQVIYNSVPPKKATDEAIKTWLDANIDSMVELIDEWDLLDKPEEEGGQPIPVTKEFLTKVLGLRRTFDLFMTIMEDFNVGEKKGRPSTTG